MAEDSGARQKQLVQTGLSVESIGLALLGHRTIGHDLIGMSVRGPRTDSEEILITLRGLSDDGTPVVAFYGGQYLGGIMVSIENHIRNGAVSWKPDKYHAK